MAFWKKQEKPPVLPESDLPPEKGQEPSAASTGKPGKKPEKTRRKVDFSQLFYNNKFILALSFVVAVCIWFAVSYSNVSNRPRVVYDVPITIEMSDASREAGLRVFDQSQQTANVSVSGNSIIVNRITAEDLEVVGTLSADVKSADGMTTYTLALTAQKKGGGVLSDYEIVSVDPSAISVDVDVYEEKNFTIDNNVKYSVNSNYYASTPTLAAETVAVSGPRSSVDKVSTVQAEYDIHDALTSTTTVSAKLVAYDQYGMVITDDNLQLSASKVDVTIPVYLRKTLDLTATLSKTPTGFGASRLEVTPSRIEVAGPEDSITDMTELSLEPVDLSQIDFNNPVLEADVTLPSGFKNVSNVWTAQVKVDLDGYSQKSFTVTNISVINASRGHSVDVLTGSVNVTLIGPDSIMSQLTADDLYMQVDMTGQTELSGSAELAATVGVTGSTSCWAVGKYTISAYIS